MVSRINGLPRFILFYSDLLILSRIPQQRKANYCRAGRTVTLSSPHPIKDGPKHHIRRMEDDSHNFRHNLPWRPCKHFEDLSEGYKYALWDCLRVISVQPQPAFVKKSTKRALINLFFTESVTILTNQNSDPREKLKWMIIRPNFFFPLQPLVILFSLRSFFSFACV